MKEKKKLPKILDSNTGSTPGESETIRVKQSIWRTYDATDGLPGGVWRLLQDRKGYLWLGTPDGVSCFDGERFVTHAIDQNSRGHRG